RQSSSAFVKRHVKVTPNDTKNDPLAARQAPANKRGNFNMLIDKLSCEEKPNLQGIFMLQPSDVNRILTLHSLGWGAKRISRELGISRTTIKKYLCLGSWR